MIKYKLICKSCEFSFDSWFSSSEEYEKLKKKNFLDCHNCNSKEVEKTLMAPKLINKSENENYGNRRIYSPYLSPSSGVVENIAEMSNSIDPIYMHNVARTKYFGISKPAKPAEHLKINLFA